MDVHTSNAEISGESAYIDISVTLWRHAHTTLFPTLPISIVFDLAGTIFCTCARPRTCGNNLQYHVL